MNNTRTNAPLTTRSTTLTACLFALYVGSMACGIHDGTATAPAAVAKQATSQSFTESARADQAEYLRQLRAKPAATGVMHRTFGDDRRQQKPQTPNRTEHSQRPPGHDPAFDAPH